MTRRRRIPRVFSHGPGENPGVGARRERLRRALEVARSRNALRGNRIGAAIIVAGLLLASAWMARVNDAIAVVGFGVAAALGLYMLWKILLPPGSL